MPLIEKKVKKLCYSIYEQVFDIEILISTWKKRKYDPSFICKRNSNELFYGLKKSNEDEEYLELNDMKYEFPESILRSNEHLAVEFLNNKLKKEEKILESLLKAEEVDEKRITLTKRRVAYLRLLSEKNKEKV